MTELLAPAGNLESLDAAIDEGADAVYLGLKTFNARMRSANFAWNQFAAAVDAVHRRGKKIYVAVNTVCEERETERLYQLLGYLDKIHPDAIIAQDFAVIRMRQEFFPNLEIHASTQMNVESAEGANLLAKEGVKRVVVARELCFAEVKKIKEESKAQIEMFAHGALCASESGLCLFSSFLGGKSANRGQCAQACRRCYTAEKPLGVQQGYFFSPYDLQLIDFVPDLMEIGIDSLKIEGRMKSAEYVGAVVAAYRHVMDNWQNGRKEAIVTGKRLLSTDFARAKTTYWYGFKTVEEGIEKAGAAALNPDQAGGTGIFLGTICALKPAGAETLEKIRRASRVPIGTGEGQARVQLARLQGGSYDPEAGDSIRLHKKDDTGRESWKVKTVETSEDGRRWIDIPDGFKIDDSVYLLQTKAAARRHPRVLPNDISRYKGQPRRDMTLPVLDLTPVGKRELSYFPEGLYFQVSSVSDLFIVQSARPARAIVELNGETSTAVIKRKTVLPLPKKMIFFSLDPFCAEGRIESLAREIDALIEMGYTQFVANNVAHIALLRARKNIVAIAGPYLYTFNRWAVSWLENQGLGAFVMPYECSRKNLEMVFDKNERARSLIPVFAYPALFRMRFKLPESYDFTFFYDKTDESFKVNSTVDGSFVMPEVACSITDKIEMLKGEGFSRFLVDFSKTKVTKGQLREVMASIERQLPLQGASRFNWKEGFYDKALIEKNKADAAAAKAERKKRRAKKPF